MNYATFLARLGAAIRSCRLARKKNQAQLADDVEVTQSTISQIENGRQGFDSLTLFRLSTQLELPLSAMFAQIEGRDLVPAPPREEALFLAAWRSLPQDAREQYRSRIETLALAYKTPVPDDDARLSKWRAPKKSRRAKATK